ncbi:uncharacterized protein LOC117420013 isoform X1 [Acipenser ruthenus]|uniref:uncharacterized protein LOC117420013 isoform X1 n=1 Tax=Acipenser ruthenus TaxID=7906 RepID=UPI00274094D6|nr:uncharacterized protein LOC117420013 isoform X1 [Acipenser ruthenus]
MPAHAPPCHACAPPNLFDGLREWNVTFVVDTSGSMYSKLWGVKEHLIQALYDRAYMLPDFKFNIVEFNSEVSKWCDRSVRCSPQTLAEAVAWIRCLECRSVSDSWTTLTALAVAIGDPACHAVCLVTDGLPDSSPGGARPWLENWPPVHVVYLRQSSPQWLLQEIARETGGTFRMSALESTSVVEAAMPLSQAFCSVLGGSDSSLCYSGVPLHWPALCNPDSHRRPVKAEVKGGSVDGAQGGPQLVRGARILARRYQDGFYYLGHLSQEVQGLEEVFTVEFESNKRFRGRSGCRLQETRLCDLVQYEDAVRCPVTPGDSVLAPWEPDLERYGPGTVLLGQESRGHNSDAETSEQGLVVNFWNGHTVRVRPGVAIQVPLQLYEFLVLELQMPLSARRKLQESSPGYPRTAPPGYRACRAEMVPAEHPCSYSATSTPSGAHFICPHRPGINCHSLSIWDALLEGTPRIDLSNGDTKKEGQGQRSLERSAASDLCTPSRAKKGVHAVGFKEGTHSKSEQLQIKHGGARKDVWRGTSASTVGNVIHCRALDPGCSLREPLWDREKRTNDEWRHSDPPPTSPISNRPGFTFSSKASHREVFQGIHQALRRDQKAIEAALLRPPANLTQKKKNSR